MLPRLKSHAVVGGHMRNEAAVVVGGGTVARAWLVSLGVAMLSDVSGHNCDVNVN